MTEVTYHFSSPRGSVKKNSPVMQETWVQSLSQEDPLEKETATHSSILAWEISWTKETGRLQSMALQRIRHNLVTKQQQQELKNKQTMMNNTINAIKNILEGINNRITEKEEQISELEDRMVKITAREQNKGKGMERNEDCLRDL